MGIFTGLPHNVTFSTENALAETSHISICLVYMYSRERSGSVVECLTRDRRAAGSSLTGVTALWSLSKTHLS